MTGEDRERRVAEVFEAGDREELIRAYARWAERYDEDMLGLEMRGPEIVASMAARYLQDRTSPILDAGADNGRVGELLAILGYSNLVALDLSDAMLARARERDVYRALHQGVLGDRLGFADDAFQATVAAGVFTAGHAPPSSIDELLRVTRSGGLIIFTLATSAHNRWVQGQTRNPHARRMVATNRGDRAVSWIATFGRLSRSYRARARLRGRSMRSRPVYD